MKLNPEWGCFFTYMSGGFIPIHLKSELPCEARLWESLHCVLCDRIDYSIVWLIMAAKERLLYTRDEMTKKIFVNVAYGTISSNKGRKEDYEG